ncbi:MAG: hypothetical protein Q8M88_05955 [Phenylobacterium sp.]|uniref:CC0125/CC1285 family lipoprotein n=1 Tax=Phenylobacterium sp. TaxID=1871053 RepID=UPI002734B3FA|nr:hypothetical protein [Phenylobacterium sp.]MDP3173959.1 hypothetical protein [Phenylobacterium sp.]
MARPSVIAAALVLAAGLAACATPTPYQPNVPGQAASGGYSEVRIEPNRWRVNFSGNSLTSRETVEGYLLFRAAELTLQQGDDWFAIVQRDTETNRQTYVEPDPFYRPWYGPSFGYWRPSWRYYGAGYGWRSWNPYFGDPFWADRVDVRTVERFEASAEVVTHRGQKPAADPNAFDARAVIDNLGPRVVRPAP